MGWKPLGRQAGDLKVAFGKSYLGPVVVAFCALLSACASSELAGEPGGVLPPPDPVAPVQEYRISANDKLSISVYPAKDMSLQGVRVDATGSILFPPTGPVVAQGKTVRELGAELQSKLADCCIKDPQVVVMVDEAQVQQVTIDGAVTQSGVYPLRGPTTLMGALAMAKGPDRTTANLKRVAVQRMAGGQRTGAIFNLEDIRAGKAVDPVIYGGDYIIVDSSQTKSAWRNVISAIPFVGAFAAF
jgi:polysaccharide export outer membrane protein